MKSKDFYLFHFFLLDYYNLQIHEQQVFFSLYYLFILDNYDLKINGQKTVLVFHRLRPELGHIRCRFDGRNDRAGGLRFNLHETFQGKCSQLSKSPSR
jgi:hypothetical protein